MLPVQPRGRLATLRELAGEQCPVSQQVAEGFGNCRLVSERGFS